jgi:nuclear polyadenylated RNA-binding protein NAB2
MATISLDTPIAEALSNSIHGRLVQEAWTQDDDTALAEYIVLMLANGKTQSQVASELAGELLPDAQGTDEFSKWLFDQVNILSGNDGPAEPQHNANDTSMTQDQSQQQSSEPIIPAAYETDMVEAPPDNAYVNNDISLRVKANIPTSPKGPRSSMGARGGRGGRGGTPAKPADSVLHRTRGNDRINSHSVRGAPKGPRNLQNRPSMQKALNGVVSGNGAAGPQANMMGNGMQNQQNMGMISPEQQMQYLAMMEQQARLMAQWNELQQGMGGGAPGPQGRSLFDRVENGRGRGGMRGRGRGGSHGSAGSTRNGSQPTTDAQGQVDGDVKMEQDQHVPRQAQDPSTTRCRFDLTCQKEDCPFAHQSPAAPMNIPIDMSLTCDFGIACKNQACTARHPSPAKKSAHQAESECKFWPNCTKPNCPFKHPTQPMCQFGASCRNAECKFTHLTTMCRFNPCTNTRCPYKHAPGQNRSMADYTWTPESAKKKEEEQKELADKEHVSDRKFVAEDGGEEELIKPEGGDSEMKTGEQAQVVAEVKSEPTVE